MPDKLRNFLRTHKDIVTYLLFGAMTTAVSFGVYFSLYNWAQISATVCNVISWIAAVLFAFVTNKPFVFHSNDWSAKTVGMELLKFVGSRVGSLLVETGIILVFVDLLCWDGNIMKIVSSIIVVVLNYLSSKMLVFRNK